MGMCRTYAGIKIQTTIFQNAVVLNPHILAFVQLMKKSQALRVFDCKWWKTCVVHGDIDPYMVLNVGIRKVITFSWIEDDHT